MPHPKDKIVELRELRALLHSQVLHRILQERRTFHQGKVNEYVRAKDWISAYGSLCRLDDIDKFGDIVQSEYKKLMPKEEK